MLELYKNIKEFRIQLGLSQEELAKKVGYKDRTSIAKIESGKVDLSQSKIMEFAKALNTSPSKLMGLTPDNTDPKKVSVGTILNRDKFSDDIANEVSTEFSDEDKKKTLEYIKFLKSQKGK